MATRQKNRIHHIFLILLIIIAVSYGTAYGEIKYTIEPNVGKLYGHTLYNISGTEYLEGYGYFNWASKLEWPIDSTVAGLNLAIDIDNTYAVEVGARKNISRDTGKIGDSDYLEGVRFIYSESDTEMDMLELNVKARFNVYRRQKNTLGIIGGFRYQDFSFEASNLVQEDIWGGYITVDGLVGTYKVKYSIPFVGVGFNIRLGERTVLDLATQLGYVIVKDEDDHVLRKKKSTGDSAGYSLGVSGSLMLNLTPNVFMELKSEYTSITAYGKQTQTWYETTEEVAAGTTIEDIDLKIESSQAMATLGIGVRF